MEKFSSLPIAVHYRVRSPVIRKDVDQVDDHQAAPHKATIDLQEIT